MTCSFKTLLWLRWRLAYHQWQMEPLPLRVFAAVGLCASAVLLILGPVAGFCAGYLVLPGLPPLGHRLTWHGLTAALLYFELLGLLVAMQRPEALDVQKLLILPVSLGEVFALNLLGFLLNLMRVGLWLTAMGLLTGVSLKAGPRWICLAPAITGLVVATGLSRFWLQSLLTAWARDVRWRRMLAAGLGFLCLLGLTTLSRVGQPGVAHPPPATPDVTVSAPSPRGPGPEQPGARTNLEGVLKLWEIWVPPLWLGRAAGELAAGRYGPAACATAAFALWSALGLWGNYRTVSRPYRLTSRGRRPRQPAAETKPTAREPAKAKGGWRLPGLSPETAAMAWTTFRATRRVPEFLWSIPFAVILPWLILQWWPRSSHQAFPALPAWQLTAWLLVAFWGQSTWLVNQFGWQGPGFAFWILSPLERTRIVLGQNLGWAGLTWLGLLPSLALGIWWIRPSPWDIAAVVLQGLAMTILACGAGTFPSLLAPYPMAPGTARRPGLSPRAWISALVSLLALTVYALAAAAGLLCGTVLERKAGVPHGPVYCILSLVFLIGAARLYAALLPLAGRMFERREREVWHILKTAAG